MVATTPLLSFKEAFPLSPHARRNPYIRTRYAVHTSLSQAAAAPFFTLHNETLNVWTGALSFPVAAWLWLEATSPHSPAPPAHRALLLQLSLWLALQAGCVCAYHALLSVPQHYNLLSAIDLAGISLLCQGLLATSHLPGMSAAHAGLSAASRSRVHSAEAALLLLCSAAVVALRLRLRRESPPLLLAANCWGYILIVIDFALGAWPFRAAAVAPALLVGGVCAYAFRFPERAMPRALFDVFNSHTLWHVCYTCSVVVYAAHAVRCARGEA